MRRFLGSVAITSMTPRIVLGGLGLAILYACALKPDVGPLLGSSCDNADTLPGTSVSFARDVRPLMVRSKGGCSCHMPGSGGSSIGTQISGLDLTSLASLRVGGYDSGSRIVVAGQPCASILYQKLSIAPPFGARMPFDGPPFWSTDELRLLHDWIAQGANDN
jgi:hypothetical protein